MKFMEKLRNMSVKKRMTISFGIVTGLSSVAAVVAIVMLFVVNSRYSIVLATAKRARQIIDKDEPLVATKPGTKPLSIAIDEVNQAKIKIVGDDIDE